MVNIDAKCTYKFSKFIGTFLKGNPAIYKIICFGEGFDHGEKFPKSFLFFQFTFLLSNMLQVVIINQLSFTNARKP